MPFNQDEFDIENQCLRDTIQNLKETIIEMQKRSDACLFPISLNFIYNICNMTCIVYFLLMSGVQHF